MTGLRMQRTVALVVEEIEVSRVFIGDNLTADGMLVVATDSAADGLRLARQNMPDVAIVAVNGGSGRDFAKLVRSGESAVDRRLPMILLGGDNHEIDTLRALDSGADDYLAKPFGYPELHARLRALLRRVQLDTQPWAKRPPVRCCGDLVLDGSTRCCTLAGVQVEQLSQKEFALLWALLEDPERVYSKDELIRAVWKDSRVGTSRTLDSHACRLRHKLGSGWIVNLWGVGYRLADACNEGPCA